jgi:hypothetical protein
MYEGTHYLRMWCICKYLLPGKGIVFSGFSFAEGVKEKI